jgi:RNA polymerase sigma-70 factor (ECF subfamily)
VLRSDVLRAEGRVEMIPAEARGAWQELEARLRPYVARRVASACDVDDVVQDVFVRMQRGMDDLRDGQSFGGWVYRIAEHAVVDHLRSRARHPLVRADSGDDRADDGEGSVIPAVDAAEGLGSELTECVALFVARLPSPYREAITLTELQGMTQKEAAEMLGVSLSGMKSRVQRGRERIRRMFEACCEMSLDARGRVTECTPRDPSEVPADCRGAAVAWASRKRCS